MMDDPRDDNPKVNRVMGPIVIGLLILLVVLLFVNPWLGR